MNWLLVLPFLIAACVGLLASFFLARGGGRDTSGRAGAYFNVQAFWIVIVMLRGMLDERMAILFLDWANWFFLFIGSLFFLYFARDVADRRDAMGEPWFWVLLVPAALFCFYLPFETTQGLVRRAIQWDGGSSPFFSYSFGPLAFIAFAYAAGLFIAAMVLFIRRLKSPREHGRPVMLVILAGSILCTAGGIFAFVRGPGGLNGALMPLFMLCGDLAFFGVLVLRGWTGPFPITRDEAFREMPEASLLFDRKPRLVDSNLAARYLLDIRSSSLNARKSNDLVNRFEGLREAMIEECGSISACLSLNGTTREFHVETSPLFRGDQRVGSLVVFHDETKVVKSGKALRTMRDRLESMYRDQMRNLADEVEKRRDAEDLLRNLNDELKNTQKEIMITLSNIVENRAKETAKHAQRVAEYSYVLARTMGVDEERAKMIRDAAPLHDVGKIAIRDNILEKPGTLDDDEWILMRTHPKVGWELLHGSKRELLKVAAIIALEHHERWDGSGYPQGLKGDAISLEGRLVAMADVIDALYSRRGYKEPWEFEKITEYINAQAGGHFDPKLVKAYDTCLPQILVIAAEYDDESRTASVATQAVRDAVARPSTR